VKAHVGAGVGTPASWRRAETRLAERRSPNLADFAIDLNAGFAIGYPQRGHDASTRPSTSAYKSPRCAPQLQPATHRALHGKRADSLPFIRMGRRRKRGERRGRSDSRVIDRPKPTHSETSRRQEMLTVDTTCSPVRARTSHHTQGRSLLPEICVEIDGRSPSVDTEVTLRSAGPAKAQARRRRRSRKPADAGAPTPLSMGSAFVGACETRPRRKKGAPMLRFSLGHRFGQPGPVLRKKLKAAPASP